MGDIRAYAVELRKIQSGPLIDSRNTRNTIPLLSPFCNPSLKDNRRKRNTRKPPADKTHNELNKKEFEYWCAKNIGTSARTEEFMILDVEVGQIHYLLETTEDRFQSWIDR
jgi:hypothetical protein